MNKEVVTMNICIPVESDAGLESAVSAHFGSAPLFLIVDKDTESYQVIQNTNSTHAHGMCQPLAALAGQAVDSVVVGGIGVGALGRFRAANVQVYLSRFRTVRETVDAFRAGALQAVTPRTACGHHGQGQQGMGSCGHHVHGGGRQRDDT